jgi:Cellulase (glycosyl hydrolase family 5)
VHEVQTLEAHGLYPVVSFFWMAPGTTKATSQSPMPDDDHAPALWQSLADTFKNDPFVVFRLKEEPYPGNNGDSAAIWSCWQNGDVQYDTSNTLTPVSSNAHCSEGYPTVGMQSLINIIRGTGAKNVIQVPGIQYANTMDQFLTYLPTDPLSDLMGVVDVYPAMNGCGSTACYDSQYAPVIAKMPLMAGEIGSGVSGTCTTSDVDTLIQWFDQHGSGYAAWDWDTWGGCLQLIADYTSATPTTPWGADYKAHLLKLAGM